MEYLHSSNTKVMKLPTLDYQTHTKTSFRLTGPMRFTDRRNNYSFGVQSQNTKTCSTQSDVTVETKQ